MTSNVNLPPPHSKRVQAWVYAILNPVIESLRREVSLLEKGNLTWRFYSRQCEYIRPICEYIDSSQLPNLDDFLADGQNSGFKQGLEDHDRAVLGVETVAARFFEGLMQSSMFINQVQTALQEYESTVRSKPQYQTLNSMRDDLPKYIGEYVINRTDSLPHHYLAHTFWEDFGASFEQSADDFQAYQQQDTFRSLKKESDTLRVVSKKLLSDLETHRFTLCSTYDIPAAPTTVEKSFSADAFLTRNR